MTGQLVAIGSEERLHVLEVRLTSREVARLEELAREADLTPDKVLLQGLRLYDMHTARLRAGETCTWSGDAERLKYLRARPGDED